MKISWQYGLDMDMDMDWILYWNIDDYMIYDNMQHITESMVSGKGGQWYRSKLHKQLLFNRFILPAFM